MKKINVLMSTYNGEKYLKEQIESVLAQEDVEVVLTVRDDGSQDSTIHILEEYQSTSSITWYKGVNLGAKYSFLDLVKKSGEYDYYAFCDQDDIWHPRKLISALNKIEKYSQEIPLLYYSETTQVDERLNRIHKQFISGKPYSFGQILIKNHASGCTMVFNNALCKLIKMPELSMLRNIPYHDHWIYLVCLSCGGEVIYDAKSYIYYRQHKNNVIGSNRSFVKKIKENGLLILNHECRRYLYTCDLWSNYSNYLTLENKKIVREIIEYKDTIEKRLFLALDNRVKPISTGEKIIIFFTVIMDRF